MSSETENNDSQLRGATRLTVDAIVGVVDIVEAMHRTITTFGGLFAGDNKERTTGLTGMVYSNIRSVTNLVGGGLDMALELLATQLGELPSSQGREAVLAALNGVIGDHLAHTNNPLAIPMQLRQEGKPFEPDREEIARAGGRILLMIHGSCGNDIQWKRRGHDHGAMLASELGFVPVYLHYNTGRHISENGSDLADLLETLVEDVPEITSLSIIAHSMGGLVARSACHQAEEDERHWRSLLDKVVFLATPHHGALWERYGNWADNILQISPYSAPFARLGMIRSAGVTDLRYGNICHQDWQNVERFKLAGDPRCAIPLPEGVDCYTVAALSSPEAGQFADHFMGDGLVQIDSALGRHSDPNMDLQFAESHQLEVRDISHLDVLCDPRVYEALEGWFTDS